MGDRIQCVGGGANGVGDHIVLRIVPVNNVQ
jgi:hypothetical protein